MINFSTFVMSEINPVTQETDSCIGGPALQHDSIWTQELGHFDLFPCRRRGCSQAELFENSLFLCGRDSGVAPVADDDENLIRY